MSMRLNRPRHADLPPAERHKANTRAKTHYLIRKGALVRQPCQICGAAKVEAHHPDYNQPALVEWYCRPHHRVQHLILRSAA